MERKKCEVEVFSRVTGFYRPTSAWNPGKKSEFGDRKTYDEEQANKKVAEDIEKNNEEKTESK